MDSRCYCSRATLSQPASTGASRASTRLCAERQLTAAEAQLALAALNALPDAGADSAAQALGATLRRHGLEREARVVDSWLAARQRQ